MADDGKDVRKAARAVLMRDYDGDHEGALERAGKLARDHPGSAIALRLVGDLNHAAAIRARKVIELGGCLGRAAERDASAHLAAARDALSEARRLVPDCVGIATALGDVLVGSSMADKAEQAYTSALAIPLPVDPALHNAAYGLHGRDRTTVNARVKDAREKANLAYGRFKKKVVDEWVAEMLQFLRGDLLRKNPRASAKEILKAQRDAVVDARKKAKSMADAMPNSARAQCFHGLMDLNFVHLLDEAIDKRSALRRSTLAIVDRAAERFPKSLVIASFRAKLLYILGDYDAAERDCRRGYTMKNPDDPADDCIPPGSIGGDNKGDRLITHVSEFHELINKIVRMANLYWNSMTQEQRGEFLSVRFDELQEDYNKVDRSSFTMSDVLRFGGKHNSYRFWVCPLCGSGSSSKKYTDTVSLLSHMCSKHQRAVLPRLRSVLDQELDRSAFDDDEYSFNKVIFSQDSDQRDIVCFEERDQMFKWLFDKPSSGVRTLALTELIETKRRTGALLLDNIKEKLKTLATDKSSTEFAEALPGIQESWIKFVKETAVDYRALILAIGRSLLWRKLKKCMSEDPEVGARRISAADIDEVFVIVAYNSGSSAVEDKTEAHMSSRSDAAQKMNGNHQESMVKIHVANPFTGKKRFILLYLSSDFHAENRSSGTIVDMKPQDPPTNMEGNGNKLDEQMEKLDIDPNSVRSSAIPQSSTPNENGAPHILVSSSQFSDETTQISIYQKSVDVLNQNSEDIFFLHLIIQTMWNLKPFRDDFLKRPPASFQLRHNGSCFSDIFYDIFSAWEKNDHHETYYSLTSLKNNLCQTVNLRAGKYFASVILDLVLDELHVSEAPLHFYFNNKIQGQVVSPIICEGCICRAHVLFGMRFLVRTSCRCGACFDEGKYSTLIHKLDAGLPQTPKIKSFADLPVAIDERFWYLQDECQSCGNLKSVGHFLLNTPHFFTVVLKCTDSSKSHVSLSELLVGCTSPPDITLATKYTLASMICCSDGQYVCISRDQNKWLIYDTKTIEAEDSWERLVQRFTDSELIPEVIIFEAAGILRLHHEGGFAAAMARAVELGLKHGGSALVLNLVGTLHQVNYTACRFMSCCSGGGAGSGKEGSAEDEEEEHKRAALSAFAAAAWLAPNCVDIAVSHAEMLSEVERYEEAYVELLRALGISDPADPAAHDVVYDVCDGETTLAERLGKAKVRTHRAIERLAELICARFIPAESVRVLDGIKLGGDAAARARARAKHLATTYPFAPRAHLLRAHVDLERVRGLDPAIDKRRFLRRTLDMVQDTAYEFQRSLVIALFRAKLMFVLDQYDDAECECHRVLAIESPFDPVVDDLPPGSVSGADYDARVCFVRNQLRTLIKKIIFSAAIYWRTLTSEDEDSLISVRVKPLIQLCNRTDKSSAKTITDAVRFFKGNNSWSFLICPLSSRCDGRKFVDTSSLWGHLCNKHPEGHWRKLQSVLGSKLSENTSVGDCSLEWITFGQDSEKHDIFRLIKINDMFDSLIRLTAGGTEPDLVEMRTEKCREGAEILEGIKKRLGTLPTDTSSSQGKLKKRMAGDPNIVGHISASKIDPIFDDAPSARCRNVSVGHDSNPSDANKMGTASQQNLKTSFSNETLKSGKDHQESEVCVENGSSGAKVDTPMDVEGIEMEIAEILANMEQNLQLEETDSKSTEEMSSTTGNENVDVNKEITDKDLFILHPIIQSLWNLRYLRDEFLMGKPAWILNISGNCCIADLIYGIFSAWEKNEHDRVAVLLASVKSSLCKIANDNMFQKTFLFYMISSYALRTIASLDWFGGSEDQGRLSELLVGIAHPLDIKLLCKGVRFSANYSLASMISYADGRYVCFARNQDKWLICDAENVEAADSWELLLERFSVCRLQPEVLFFEVIKGSRAQRKEAAELERRRLEAERALRREAVAALRMYREEGRHDEAIARAEELAAGHPGSAVAAHLAAVLHHDATNRAVDGASGQQPSAAGKHLHPARDFYIRAARLAPNCVEIATSLATVRFACLDDDDADLDIRRAVTIDYPTDPADNNVAYDLDDDDGATPKDRIANARAAAIERYNLIMAFVIAKVIPRAVRGVLDVAEREGAAKAVKPAKALAARYPYSARALFAHAHVDVEFARGLAPGIDKRPFLDRLLGELNGEALRFDTSLVLAAFRAKLVFLLGSYVSAEGECSRGLHMVGAADPADEDVPPGSVPGENSEDRQSAVRVELGRLFQKIVLATKDYWSSLPREKQDRFRFAGFNSMHQHYAKNYDDTHEGAKTISDALSFVRKNRSWRFWICPYCVGKKIPDTDSLLQHMRNKHPEGGVWLKLLSILDPKSVDSSEGDYFLDDVAVCQDSEENYVLRFERMDHIFKYLFLRATGTVEHKQFSELRETKCKEGIEILEMMKPKLKNVPTDISSSEFNEACAEIQDMWNDFLEISVLDYRVVITPLAICFISEQLLLSMSNDEKAASKSIDAADIDALFPNVDDTPDIDAIFPKVGDAPSAADTSKTGEDMASTISDESIYVLEKDNTDKDLIILHVIIQSLWHLRFFRIDFLRERSVWILCINEDHCIADQLYEIFSAWEKNENDRVAVFLTSMKASLCKIANDNMFQKLQAGKLIASEAVAMILQGLHMSGTSFHFEFNNDIEGRLIKSFAELPVLYDEQSCFEANCEHCGSPKNTDVFPSNTPHFFTIGLDWSGGCENQVELSEVLVGIAHPLDIKLLCKGVHSSANYSLTSMISYADGRYICFARDQDKDCTLQPEVLFFEVIK
uniref:C2H2-type domain-containing protein n=1 Tax=Oryza glumipatula TaxID=40148 RepID=A0A0E0BKW9_9ORYZ